MKRFLVLTSAMVLTLSMAACADKQTTPPPSSSDPNSSVTQQQPSGSDKNPGGSAQQNSTAPTTKTGVGVVISLENSWGATTDKPAGARTEVTVCAASFEKDGKIASVRFDAAEPGVDFDAAGALTTDLTQEVKTKRQLGDDYGMKEASSIGKEWYQQVDSLEQWMTGRSVEEVLGMKTVTRDDAEYTDEADLASSATISVDDFLKALEAAYDDAQNSQSSGSAQQSENGSKNESENMSQEQQSSGNGAN